jgi:hypothetical protein
MGKKLAWFGEIERKLAKLSMTTFTYRSPSLFILWVIYPVFSNRKKKKKTGLQICVTNVLLYVLKVLVYQVQETVPQPVCPCGPHELQQGTQLHQKTQVGSSGI